MMINTEKLEVLEHYLKNLMIGFVGKKNNYIEYKSKGDRYENLSPKEYLDEIRPYLRNLINNHKTSMESNSNSNNSNSNSNINNNNNNNNNNNTDRAEGSNAK